MDIVVTPQPHFIPGYMGHCPNLLFREGGTYGKLTHKLFIDPCARHAPELILSPPNQPLLKNYPTEAEVQVVKEREKRVDAVYKYPLIPGYAGFVPNLNTKTGKRYLAAAADALCEHERLMELYRCENRRLKHTTLMQSGEGVFEPKLRERMIPLTHYRAPLIPVKPRAQAITVEKCRPQSKKEPYSKWTAPHFMEADNEEKFIIQGYCGHIPMASTRFGETNKKLTNGALAEFLNSNRQRQSEEWCPLETAGLSSSCPNTSQFAIYHRTIGLLPKYSGHVPGEAFTFGKTFGNATVDAKRWLALNKELNDMGQLG